MRLTKQQEIRGCCPCIFTETCLHHNIMTEAVALDKLTVFRADREQDYSRTRSGRVCVYVTDAYTQSKLMNTCLPDDYIIVTILLLLFTIQLIELTLMQTQKIHHMLMYNNK